MPIPKEQCPKDTPEMKAIEILELKPVGQRGFESLDVLCWEWGWECPKCGGVQLYDGGLPFHWMAKHGRNCKWQ